MKAIVLGGSFSGKVAQSASLLLHNELRGNRGSPVIFLRKQGCDCSSEYPNTPSHAPGARMTVFYTHPKKYDQDHIKLISKPYA